MAKTARNLAQKLIARARVDGDMSPGSEVRLKADQVLLQVDELGIIDAHLSELTEAGVDAIDLLAAIDHGRDAGCRASDPIARRLAERHGGRRGEHGTQVVER